MKLQQKHYDSFKKKFNTYCKKLGIDHWLCEFRKSDDEDCRAGVLASPPDLFALIEITEEWDIDATDANLDKTAKHEAIELLLSPLFSLSMERFVTEREIETERHRVVRKIEALL